MFSRLTEKQIEEKAQFIGNFIKAKNAADGSAVDANSNVTQKSMATMEAELYKDYTIQVNRKLVHDKIEELYDKETADQYINDLNNHLIYTHDESSTKPYTYSPKECVQAVYNGVRLLVNFDVLFDMCTEKESEEESGVWCKYPRNLYVVDKGGLTKVTRITKKDRHRKLVRVKTKNGEDIVVTDNHPMIVDDDGSTVIAEKSLGSNQFASGNHLNFKNTSNVEISSVVACEDVYDNFVICRDTVQDKLSPIKRFITMDEELGYFIGFFIGDGNYVENSNIIGFTQKTPKVLHKLNSIIYDKFSICGKVRKNGGKYVLTISSYALKYFLHDYLKVASKAQHKTLPANIMEFSKEFARGVIEGIIDSDGTVTNKNVLIRLSSRGAITQLTVLAKIFGYKPKNSYQATPFGNNDSYHTNYSIWGITFSITDKSNYKISYKLSNQTVDIAQRYIDGWREITSVVSVNDYADTCPYIYDITTETHTFISNNLYVHNCASISLYPFLLEGTKCLGGVSKAPKNLQSFNGSFVNFIYQVASDFAGACATVEYLHMFDWFARNQYGENYLDTHKKEIAQEFQGTVYALNQPASARGNQSIFWNISVFDHAYMKSMFDEFFYPDGTQVDFESTMRLQKFFMEWFRKEREKELLTFPVLTASVLEKEDGTGFVDDEFVHYCADEMEKGLSFFVYQSKSADSLASCCFSGDTKVDIVTDRYSIMTFKDAYKHFKNKTVTTTLDGDNAKAKIVRLPKGKHQMYKLTFKDGKTLVCTDNHIHVTDDGDKDTTELTVGTKLIKYNGFTIIDKIEKIDIKDRYVYCFEMEDKKNPYFNLASGIKTHNCRLRNELAENDFSYTLGAGGVITGSSQVITINANRLFQRYGGFKELPNVVDRLHKYLTAFKALYKGYIDAGLLPTYTAGVMDIDKQFVTIGINGMVEAAESQGIEATNNPEYKEFLQKLLGTIKDKNTEYRHKTGIKVNTECVPRVSGHKIG